MVPGTQPAVARPTINSGNGFHRTGCGGEERRGLWMSVSVTYW
jgi:hypothetical protein